MIGKACGLSFAAVFLCLASPLTLAAQRTFVGATGTDNPACSLPAPCRTFTAALAAASDMGEVIVLDSAGYGTVTITKSVSIIAPPGIYAGISVLSGDGVTINAPGATVVLRGLTINGQGGVNGIRSLAAARVRVESCVVSGMGAVGIYHQADYGEMIVLDTIVRDNADGLGLVAHDASITLDRVRSEHNANTGFYLASTPIANPSQATIVDSVFSDNPSYGIWADAAVQPLDISVARSVLSNSAYGFHINAGASGTVSHVHLADNAFVRNGLRDVNVEAPFGRVYAMLSYNNLSVGVVSQGAQSFVELVGNAGSVNSFYLDCVDGGHVSTWQNNSFSSGGCFLSLTPRTPI